MDARGPSLSFGCSHLRGEPAPPNGRLRQTVTRELIVDRRIDDPGEAAAAPRLSPEANEENSWLTYDDPQGKFHFRFPQEFRPGRPPDDFSLELVRPRPGGPDTLEFQRVVKTGDAEADRLNRDPEFHLKMLKERVAAEQVQRHPRPARLAARGRLGRRKAKGLPCGVGPEGRRDRRKYPSSGSTTTSTSSSSVGMRAWSSPPTPSRIPPRRSATRSKRSSAPSTSARRKPAPEARRSQARRPQPRASGATAAGRYPLRLMKLGSNKRPGPPLGRFRPLACSVPAIVTVRRANRP